MATQTTYDKVMRQLRAAGQDQVLAHYHRLSPQDQATLLADLETVDLAEVAKQFSLCQSQGQALPPFGPADFIRRPEQGGDPAAFKEARAAGIEHIQAGRLAAFVVAGGQGSRLGYEGPKGAFRFSPLRSKSLFQLHCEKLRAYARKYRVDIPFYVMTSEANHRATIEHFSTNDFFGLDNRLVHFFSQAMIPTLDQDGRLLLAGPDRLLRNPDGHGGSLTALRRSGALARMAAAGVETIAYFQVDNPSLPIIDPTFIGFHRMAEAEVSTKVLTKAGWDEKVGNLVRFEDGRYAVVEYSDLPEDLARETTADGQLRYQAGSIGIHLFSRQFVERLGASPDFDLPYHLARKKVEAWSPEGPRQIEAIKFEKFVFDALPLAARSCNLEVLRQDEFAPVKNATGVDSVHSAQTLLMDMHRRWLLTAGYRLPPRLERLEISPLLAVEAEDLPEELELPDQTDVYLE